MTLTARQPSRTVPARLPIALSALAILAVGAGVASLEHQRPKFSAAPAADERDWTGRLADVASQPEPTRADAPMTSASLVVPNATLALPPSHTRTSPSKARPCGAAPCATHVAAAPAQATRQVSSDEVVTTRTEPVAEPTAAKEVSFGTKSMGRLAEAVRQPFSYASDRIASWIGRL